MDHRFRGIGRAAWGGLVVGLMGASGIFLTHAWRNAHFECEFPETEECVFETTTALEVARLQAYASIGVGLLSAGLYLAVRRRSSKDLS